MPKLTKRTVDALKPGPRTVFLMDDSLPGFGVRLTPAGVKSYVFQWGRGRSLRRRLTIGRHGAPWTPDSARSEAKRLRGEVAKGGDPAAIRAAAHRAPTVKEFSGRFLTEHVEPKTKPSSARAYRSLLSTVILPAFGPKKLADVTRADVSRLHHSKRGAPYAANRTLAVLSKMFNLAEAWGIRPDGSNPCRHVAKFRERRRERFLSAAELLRVGDALLVAEREGILSTPKARGKRPLKSLKVSPYATAALRLLLMTGCRLSEIVTLRWDYLDEEHKCLRLPDSKTGAKAVHLSAPAFQLLSNLARVDDSPFVFVGRSKGSFKGLPHVWHRVRKLAGVPDVRIHDLRHSFASFGAAGGESLLIIGALLGHRTPGMTARYAHLSDDPRRAAADRIAGPIAIALEGSAGVAVVTPAAVSA